MALNKVILHGRLTKDPEVRYTQEGTSIASFTLAVDRYNSKTKSNEADFIRCVAFGKTAENCEKYYQKGRETVVQGSVKTGSYDNKDGQKVYTTDIWVESMDFCGSKGDTAANSNYDPATVPNSALDEVPFN